MNTYKILFGVCCYVTGAANMFLFMSWLIMRAAREDREDFERAGIKQ
jgi:hypothetical protein